MTEGVIKILREGEETGQVRFSTRREMCEKLTDLRRQIEKYQFPFLYELSVTLKYNEKDAAKLV